MFSVFAAFSKACKTEADHRNTKTMTNLTFEKKNLKIRN